MEVALGAIALATAVKDMVELGQKIDESFAKVSKNLRNAKRIAQNIKEMVEEINAFCESNTDALDDMKDFDVALQGLVRKFKDFETSILPLLSRTGGSKFEVFLRGWWNNNRIQERILNLESDIVKVIRGYMLKSAIRTEVKQEKNHQEAIQGLTAVRNDVTQVLAVVERGVYPRLNTAVPHCSTTSSGMTSNDFEHSIVMFAQSTTSTSAPMLRTPTSITEEVATTIYIKVQINQIAMIVEKMSTIPISPSDCIVKFSSNPIVESASRSITHLRHHVVREVTHIRELLDIEHPQAISIYNGARILNDLSVALDILGMHHETTLVGKWTITLARRLTGLSGGNPNCDATLAFYLLNQSIHYSNTGNKSQSLQAIEEADTIMQNMLNQYTAENCFQILHSQVLRLLQYAQLIDNNQSVKLAMEAVKILGGILNVQTQSALHEQIGGPTSQPSSPLEQRFSNAMVLNDPCTTMAYAQALQQLGRYLFTAEACSGSAWDLVLLSVEIHQKLASTHGDEYKLHLAKSLSLLSIMAKNGVASGISAEKLLDLVDECIQLLRDLAEKNPGYYAQELVYVLWAKADTLDSLEWDNEAISAWEGVTSLAGQIVQDSALYAYALTHLSAQFWRLKRHNEAIRTINLEITANRGNTENQALNYFNLSRSFQHLGCHEESVNAAQKSVRLYQLLVIKDPQIWATDLAICFAHLAHGLATLEIYTEAVLAWKESANIINNFLENNRDAGLPLDFQIINSFCAAVTIHYETSLILKDQEDCLKVCYTAVQHLHQLSEMCPQTEIVGHVFQAEFLYAYNIFRFGQLEIARQYIDHWLDRCFSRFSANSRSDRDVIWRAKMTNLKADVSYGQGCTKLAMLTTQGVRDIVAPFVGTSQCYLLEMVKSMHYETQLQSTLADGEKALQVYEDALQLARCSELEPIIDVFVWSFHAVAFAALLNQNYGCAVEAAKEGSKLTTSPEWEEDEFDAFIRPSLLAILSSAEANLGRVDAALEYAQCAVELSLDMRDRKMDVSSTTAEKSYMETRGNLAEILLATGDFVQARQICEERRSYFSKRVDTRMGEYRELSPILHMLGILCCSEGRHEEGDAAAKELVRIIKTLGSAFPSLQEEVKIRLRRQTKVPILKVLDEMSGKLECGHQKEVNFLWLV